MLSLHPRPIVIKTILCCSYCGAKIATHTTTIANLTSGIVNEHMSARRYYTTIANIQCAVARCAVAPLPGFMTRNKIIVASKFQGIYSFYCNNGGGWPFFCVCAAAVHPTFFPCNLLYEWFVRSTTLSLSLSYCVFRRCKWIVCVLWHGKSVNVYEVTFRYNISIHSYCVCEGGGSSEYTEENGQPEGFQNGNLARQLII